MSHINENSIFGTLAGGSVMILLGRLYLNRLLRDIEHAITSLKNLEGEMIRVATKLEFLERERSQRKSEDRKK